MPQVLVFSQQIGSNGPILLQRNSDTKLRSIWEPRFPLRNGGNKCSNFFFLEKKKTYRNRVNRIEKCVWAARGGRGGGTFYNGLSREAPLERETCFRLQVYKGVGVSLVDSKYMKRWGNLSFQFVKWPKLANRHMLWLKKKKTRKQGFFFPIA